MNTGTTITYVYGYNLYVNTTNKCDFSCDFCVRHNSHIGSVPASDLWLRREPTVAGEKGAAVFTAAYEKALDLERAAGRALDDRE